MRKVATSSLKLTAVACSGKLALPLNYTSARAKSGELPQLVFQVATARARILSLYRVRVPTCVRAYAVLLVCARTSALAHAFLMQYEV